MKAAVLRKLNEPLSLEDVSLPKLGKGHVLVKMQEAAVCHSQKLEISGRRGADLFLPHLVGHEGVGIVLDTGPGVHKVKAGDQVILSWIRGSGSQADPIRYHSKNGSINAGPIATFCETPIIAEQCVTPISVAVPPDQGVLIGCALATGAGTVWKAVSQDIRESICILGAGGVGLSAVAGAVSEGWKQIIVVDLKYPALECAKKIGATHTVCAASEDVFASVQKMTNGTGCDLVVECAGSVKTMAIAPRLGKRKKSQIVIVGNLTSGHTFPVDPFDLIHGRHLTGSWGGWVDPDKDFSEILNQVLLSKIKIEFLLGSRFRLDNVNQAINELDKESTGRPVLEFL